MDTLINKISEKLCFDFEEHVKNKLQIDIDGSLSGKLCRQFLRGTCLRGTTCPLQHTYGLHVLRFPSEKSVVCKHWLRGLCKKGELCEFLHEYNLKKMPECWFFTKYGECSNPDCFYQHIDPNSKTKECIWYARGFCKHGYICRNKHARKSYCSYYLAGFCPFGKECEFSHPSFDILEQ